MNPVFLALAAGLLAAGLPAQSRIWIVDAANGPGAHFTTLEAAVHAAAGGDRIFVRAGTYMGVAVAKPLSIVGEPGVRVWPGGATYAGLRVYGIRAGETFAARGLDIGQLPLGSGVTLGSCDGTVLLEEISHSGGFEITNCRDVRLTSCRTGSLLIDASSVSVDRGVVGTGGLGTSPAITVRHASAVLSRCVAIGNNAIGSLAPGAAIECSGASLIITGDGSGGFAAGFGTAPVPAIVGSGTLTVDPHVLVLPSGSAPPIDPNIAVTSRAIPSLRAVGGPVGGTVSAELFAPAGAPYLLVVGLPAAPVPLVVLHGSVWLDGLVPVVAGTMPATGRVTTSLNVPQSDELFARSFTWQAAAGDGAGGPVALSNPGTYVHGF